MKPRRGRRRTETRFYLIQFRFGRLSTRNPKRSTRLGDRSDPVFRRAYFTSLDGPRNKGKWTEGIAMRQTLT